MRRLASAVIVLVGCRGGAASPTQATVAPVNAPPQAVASEAPLAANTRVELVLGTRSVCARIEGRVFCADGLDPDAPLASGKPVVDGGAIGVSAARTFACAAMADGTVRCWGANDKGQLGARSREGFLDVPVAVKGVAHATKVLVGDTHACAVTDAGGMLCWGNNEVGETAGDARWGEDVTQLIEANVVPNLDGVSSALVVVSTSCAWRRDRSAVCWGILPFAPRGDFPGSEVPTRIPELDGFDSVAADGFCGVKDGAVSCWTERERPRAIALPARIRKVAVGDAQKCALAIDGSVYCWETDAARRVGGLPRAIDLWAGAQAACALAEDRQLWCWGRWITHGRQAQLAPEPVVVRIE